MSPSPKRSVHGRVHATQNPSAGGEWRLRGVVALTVAMMVLEVAGGLVFGSKALLAEGWHMGTHAAALGMAAFAYAYARKNARSERYCFGTGKVGALGGFASAVGLAVVAVYLAVASLVQVTAPTAIQFDQAIAVAALGLVVNLACVGLLHDPVGRGAREHGHAHSHEKAPRPGRGAPEPHPDLNRRGAFLHVAADAVTSIAAILALLAGKYLGWTWTDPAMGMAGAFLVGRWSVGLIRETSSELLDEASPEQCQALRRAVERQTAARVADLRLWSVGSGRLAAAVSILDERPRPPGHYRALLGSFLPLDFVAVEVNRPGAEGSPGLLPATGLPRHSANETAGDVGPWSSSGRRKEF